MLHRGGFPLMTKDVLITNPAGMTNPASASTTDRSPDDVASVSVGGFENFDSVSSGSSSGSTFRAVPRKRHLQSLRQQSSSTSSRSQYHDGLDGLSRRVRDLQGSLCNGGGSGAGGGGDISANAAAAAAARAGGRGRRGPRTGSFDMLRSVGTSFRNISSMGRRRASADDDGTDSSTCCPADGNDAAIRFVESAAYLVSALCGLSDSSRALGIPPRHLDRMWEHSRNLDTSLCGLWPILLSASNDGTRCDVIVRRKLGRMCRLADALSETVRRVSDEIAPFGPEVECCFGTFAEMLCLTCVEAIRRACSATAGSGAAFGGGAEEEEEVTWRISDALAESWFAAGQRAALSIVCDLNDKDDADTGNNNADSSRDGRIVDGPKPLDVKSNVLVEACLLVLGSLRWSPGAACEMMAEEQRGRSALEKARRDGPRRAALDDSETLARLGNAYASMGEHDLALDHYNESLRIRKFRLGPNHLLVTELHESIGDVHSHRGDYRSASLQLDEALRSLDASKDDEDDDDVSEHSATIGQKIDAALIRILRKRSDVQAHLGQIDESLSSLCRCLRVQRSVLGIDHPSVADTLCQRATLTLHGMEEEERRRNSSAEEGRRERDGEAAMADFWEALRIRKLAFGAEHPIAGDTFHEMGMVAWGIMGDAETALELLSDSLWIRQQTKDESQSQEDRLADADTRAVIAAIHRKLGRTNEAVSMLEESLEVLREELGDDAERVADVHVALGHAHIDSSDWGCARNHYIAALAILEKDSSSDETPKTAENDTVAVKYDDPRVPQLLHYLANVELKDGNFGPARGLIQRYVRLRQSAGGGEKEDCLRAKKMLDKLVRAEKEREKKELMQVATSSSSWSVEGGGTREGRDGATPEEGGDCQRRGSF